ncbi:rhodanese-like domain-containing protein [Formosa sp. S-31]|uniref:rhodanese-like domain-containing protein n=1 Tax=Formosa sp. S-31 TaxID=2790949 RepID=UPI003EBD707B
MKPLVLNLGIVLVLLCGVSCKDDTSNTIEQVSVTEMQSIIAMDDVQLVDVRHPSEIEEHGYIHNSQNIDFNSPTFKEDIKNLDKQRPVVLYCHSGTKSSKCAKELRAAGFVKVYDLQGGISEWKHKGNPVKYLVN